MAKKSRSITIEEELIKLLERESEIDGRSFSNMIETIVKKHYKRRNKAV